MPPVPDYADQRPVYAQIADDLRGRIKAGEHQPGDRLPANRVLSRRYESSMATIRQAIDVLRGEGLVETQSTRGTFVLREPAGEPSQFDVAMARMDDLAEELRQLRGEVEKLQRER
jgi:DNA-binding GntR family transcriptional regulator